MFWSPYLSCEGSPDSSSIMDWTKDSTMPIKMFSLRWSYRLCGFWELVRSKWPARSLSYATSHSNVFWPFPALVWFCCELTVWRERDVKYFIFMVWSRFRHTDYRLLKWGETAWVAADWARSHFWVWDGLLGEVRGYSIIISMISDRNAPEKLMSPLQICKIWSAYLSK